MALVIIYAVLSNFDYVAKFTVKNLNKDFINAGRGGGGHRFMKAFHKKTVFFERWLPLLLLIDAQIRFNWVFFCRSFSGHFWNLKRSSLSKTVQF